MVHKKATMVHVHTLKGGQLLLPAIFRLFPYFPWVVSMVIFFGVFFWGALGAVFGAGRLWGLAPPGGSLSKGEPPWRGLG